ncbi:MAG TPA: GTP-binding protein [Chloroflexi bacterium]|nr:GTP-binding protein [Chloroflexota bacterium]
MSLPTRLRDVRQFIDALDLKQIEAEVAEEARARLIIVGPVNSGKSTLFNRLKGKKLSTVSAVPGTTRDVITEQFGPFWLVDTPGFGEVAGRNRAELAMQAAERASVAILVLDASAGVRASDAGLYRELRALGLPVVVALNKIDLIRRDLSKVLHDAELKLGVPVIPISAKHGTGIAEHLIPAILDAHPQMAVTVGRALPQFRRLASGRVIRQSSMLASFIGAEPIPGLSLPFLVAVQVRMLLRLAAIYGENMSVARARELIGAIAGGLVVRYAAQEVAKLVPALGWVAAGLAAGSGTFAIGQASVVFFENSQKLAPEELRSLYKRFRRRGRRSGGGLDESDVAT